MFFKVKAILGKVSKNCVFITVSMSVLSPLLAGWQSVPPALVCAWLCSAPRLKNVNYWTSLELIFVKT